jgi:hypothetical protein
MAPYAGMSGGSPRILIIRGQHRLAVLLGSNGLASAAQPRQGLFV